MSDLTLKLLVWTLIIGVVAWVILWSDGTWRSPRGLWHLWQRRRLARRWRGR